MVEKTSSSTHCCKKARAPKKAELSNAVIFGGTWKQIISTLRRGDSKARELAERLEGLATSDVSAIDRPPPAAAGIWGVTFFWRAPIFPGPSSGPAGKFQQRHP
jgi:hypothetical protein